MKNEFKIELVNITKEDTPLIVKWRNNENVRRNFIFQEKFTNEIHNNWMDTKVATGEVVQFIIKVKENNKSIGSVYFRDIDNKTKEAEYGIFIGEDEARGKGYGTEAAKLALEYAFTNLKLKTVFLRVFAENKGAIKSYEKAGFVKEDRIENVIIDNKERKVIFMKKNNDLI